MVSCQKELVLNKGINENKLYHTYVTLSDYSGLLHNVPYSFIDDFVDDIKIFPNTIQSNSSLLNTKYQSNPNISMNDLFVLIPNNFSIFQSSKYGDLAEEYKNNPAFQLYLRGKFANILDPNCGDCYLNTFEIRAWDCNSPGIWGGLWVVSQVAGGASATAGGCTTGGPKGCAGGVAVAVHNIGEVVGCLNP